MVLQSIFAGVIVLTAVLYVAYKAYKLIVAVPQKDGDKCTGCPGCDLKGRTPSDCL